MVGPSRSASSCWSAAASCSTVTRPSSANLRAVRRPMPHKASVGLWAITSYQFSAVSRYTPAGFAKPVANFARSLLSPIPIDEYSRVALSTVS